MMENKRAQFKIQQMAFMLMAVFILFAIAGLFYFSVISLDLRKQATIVRQQEAMLMAERLAGTAEFTCGEAFCIDADKALMLKENTRYRELWGVTSIKITKLYPVSGEVECTRGNYPNCGKITILSSVKNAMLSSAYVALCRKDRDKINFAQTCELGLLSVGVEIKV